MKKALVALLLSACSALASAAPQTYRFYGYAYDLASGEYLYTEVHRQEVDGDRWIGGSIKYYAPDGRQIASKVLDFSQNPYVPVYKLDLPGEKYAEGISGVKDGIVMFKTIDGQSRSKTVAIKGIMAADSGFHSLIVDRFADLLAHQPVSFGLAVAGKLDVFKFRIQRIADTEFDGKPAVRLQVEADSLLRLVAPSLELTYDPSQKKLLEYRGVSNIHDPASGKVYSARIVYADKPPADAPKNLPPLE